MQLKFIGLQNVFQCIDCAFQNAEIERVLFDQKY